MKQTGLIIIEPRVGDWLAGQETGIVKNVRVENGSWLNFLPVGEKQYKLFSFDTMSCTAFSMLNSIEIQMKQMSLSQSHKDFIRLFGFSEEFNCSDRFSAIMSGTTPRGNTIPAVWDSARNDGLLPDKDLPFIGNTFGEYHDKRDITPYMIRKAKKFKEFFNINYEWVNISQIGNSLRYSPLQVAVPIPATHAEVLIEESSNSILFDTYEPFMKLYPKGGIHYAMAGILTINENAPIFPSYVFTKYLEKDQDNEEVLALQKVLCYFGHMNVATGFFGDVTKSALKEFQAYNNIDPIGVVGPKTRAFLNGLIKTTKTNGQKLYETALSCLGVDLTPRDEVPDDVACAVTVNALYKKTFGSEIGGGASTKLMYESLKKDGRFLEVKYPIAGDIIISPTGYGNGKLSNGHVGIVGNYGKIMSNSSPTGLLTQNFTLETWNARYKNKGGFPVFFYRVV